MPDYICKNNVVKLHVSHQVNGVEVFSSPAVLWKRLDVYKSEEEFSLCEVGGQKVAEVFSIFV